MIPPTHTHRRRRLLRLLRRIGVLVSVALLVAAVILFAGIGVSEQVSKHATQELLNGQANTTSVLLPLGLFLLGIVGLAISLR
ncbi:MAG TPA: hypothetical protein VHB98_20355 [Chloroflexota bacterium]|jgi:hypothetical protein|nr:hypothetical protein [Chloroflexota bacterium]